MTDEQIVRALECCVEGDTFCYGCGEDCPFIDVDMCTVILRRETLDLIKRQQVEIEKLKQKTTELRLRKEMYRVTVDEVRVEAVKEFVEKLKELSVYGTIREYLYANNMSYMLEDMVSEGIDILVKEMTEKKGGKG